MKNKTCKICGNSASHSTVTDTPVDGLIEVVMMLDHILKNYPRHTRKNGVKTIDVAEDKIIMMLDDVNKFLGLSKKDLIKAYKPTQEEKWREGFIDFVIKEWKKKSKVIDEAETRVLIDTMLFLLFNYRLKCLIGTIIDIDDLLEKYAQRKKA